MFCKTYYLDSNMKNLLQLRQGGRSWHSFGEEEYGHTSLRQHRICYFRDKCFFARNCKFASLLEYNMQYNPCNSELLKNTVFFPPKKLVLPELFQKVRKWEQILISGQNSVCQGIQFSSRSKLFGEDPSCQNRYVGQLIKTKIRCSEAKFCNGHHF